MIAPGIRLAILANATVLATVVDRCYFVKLPQKPTYPAITVELISGDLNNCLNELPALTWSRVRVNCWATTYEAAVELAAAVETALNGQTITVSGLLIRSVVADGMRDFYEPEVEAYYATQDYRIWHRPS